MPVDHLLTFCRIWDDSSAVVPTKPPRYLVSVTTSNPRWLKHALAHSTIAGLTPMMDLDGSGKYSLTGPVVISKLKTFLYLQNSPKPLHHQHTKDIIL